MDSEEDRSSSEGLSEGHQGVDGVWSGGWFLARIVEYL